ncbi:pyridoxal phosphate-dependent decarboxylase family protein [Flavobacterium soyangense]|uniref:Aspartate aminotransferase family protein n=1 Tax=Flavobacterium soyangense TaxID=2023265 RepID=A0A930U9P9_9FLAO|nr:pyridoxal-dependent decarboxylase [Flavobacterium soyangense]MBF2709538.1 aspartate aminotransferase family protein [Flavobacterium soyangense]
MNDQLNLDLLNLENLLETVKDQGLKFLQQIEERPTSTKYTIETIDKLSDIGFGGLETLKIFNQKFEKLIVGSSGPRYWGFVTGGSTPASIMGDWLTTIYDQNTKSPKGQGDLSAIIEIETTKLLLDLLNLPKDFIGGFVTGATISNFTCLGVARQWIGKEQGIDFAKNGVSGNIKILSASPHSSVIKSLSMLGIGSNNCIKVKVAKDNRESIDIEDLENKIKELNGEAFILISNAGTVNTTDFDDFKKINKLRKKFNFWWHIDGAFGAFAVCSPKYKHLLKGWENADSITVDCHKWLNVPYESAVFFVKEKHKILQTETFQNSNAPYLGNPLENFSYLNFLPENSRRLKALPVWFSLNAYGKKGYQDIVENSAEMANLFGAFIEKSEMFELLAPVRLNNVCFTLSGMENQDKISTFLTQLNETEKVFMTPTVYNDKKGIRASFVNWRTTKQDIEIAITEMERLKTTI